MILLINFYFQDGNFVSGNTSWWSDFFTYFGAIGIPLLIFYFTIRHDKKKELREIKRVEDDKIRAVKKKEEDELRYFVGLLRGVVKASKKQVVNIKTTGDKLEKKPFDTFSLIFVINEDLRRILHGLNHQGIFNAFANSYGNSDEDILNFQKLFGRLDFLQANFKIISDKYRRYVEEDVKRKEKYKYLVEEQILSSATYIGNKIKTQGLTGKHNQLQEILSKYIKLYNTEIVKTNSLIKIQEKLINPLKLELWENFRDSDDVFFMVDNCRKATFLLSEIKFNSNAYSKSLIEADKGIRIMILELIGLSNYFFSEEEINEMKVFESIEEVATDKKEND